MNDSTNVLRMVSATLLTAGVCLLGCSDDNGPNGPINNGNPDSGFMDAEVVVADAGLLSRCPVPGNFPDNTPECVQAMDCADREKLGQVAEEQPPQSNCEFCRSYNNAICNRGRCEAPERLGPNEGILMRFSIVGFEAEIQSFAGVAVAAETTGGDEISCADVYAGTDWDLTETCFNWVDSRFNPRGGEPAQAFPVRFGGFPGGRRVLLIVYGFAEENARGEPVAFSCTEVDVQEPGTQTQMEVTGDMMRAIR